MKPAGMILLMLALVLFPVLVQSEDITLIKHARKKGAVTSEAPPMKDVVQYRVKSGDTLRKILIKNYGAKPEDLPYLYRQVRQANPGIRNLNNIMSGRRISIPRIPSQNQEKEPLVTPGNYVVIKKGEHLAKVLREVYGLSDDAIFHDYLKKIKDLNPEIEDLNFVVAGQKIRMPEIRTAARKTMRKTTVSSSARSKKDRRDLKPRKVIIQELEDIEEKDTDTTAGQYALGEGEKKTSQNKINDNGSEGIPGEGRSNAGMNSEGTGPVVRSGMINAEAPRKSAEEEAREMAARQLVRDSVLPVLKEMGSIQRDHGKYFLPLAGDENVSIDTGEIPMIELDNGTRIFIDVNNRISPETRRLIEQTYPSCKVVSGPAENLDVLMDRILSACGYFSVNRDSGPILAGEDEKIRLFGKWVVYKEKSRRNIIVINILTNEENRTPDSLKNYASRFGISLVEIGGKQIPVSKPAQDILPALGKSYEKLLGWLGISCEKDKYMELVSVDSLKISYTAPLLTGKIILAEEMPDKTMLDLLGKRGYFVFHTRTVPLSNVLEGLGLSKQGPPIRVIIAKNRTELDLPALEINHVIILDHPVDKNVARYLSTTELKIVVW